MIPSSFTPTKSDLLAIPGTAIPLVQASFARIMHPPHTAVILAYGCLLVMESQSIIAWDLEILRWKAGALSGT